MAKTWSVSEAVKEINAGNKEAIADIGKRFPQFAVAAAKVGNNEGAMTILGALPEHVTARKVEAILKDGIDEVEDSGEVDEVEDSEEEVKPRRGRKAATSTDDDKKAKAKARREARKAAKAKEEVEDEESESDEEESEGTDYSTLNAVELYKLCKKRKLDVEPKKKAAYYIDILNNADSEDEADDDWEEEEERPEPKKGKGRPAKKAAEEKEEDDDWDI